MSTLKRKGFCCYFKLWLVVDAYCAILLGLHVAGFVCMGQLWVGALRSGLCFFKVLHTVSILILFCFYSNSIFVPHLNEVWCRVIWQWFCWHPVTWGEVTSKPVGRLEVARGGACRWQLLTGGLQGRLVLKSKHSVWLKQEEPEKQSAGSVAS